MYYRVTIPPPFGGWSTTLDKVDMHGVCDMCDMKDIMQG